MDYVHIDLLFYMQVSPSYVNKSVLYRTYKSRRHLRGLIEQYQNNYQFENKNIIISEKKGFNLITISPKHNLNRHTMYWTEPNLMNKKLVYYFKKEIVLNLQMKFIYQFKIISLELRN